MILPAILLAICLYLTGWFAIEVVQTCVNKKYKNFFLMLLLLSLSWALLYYLISSYV